MSWNVAAVSFPLKTMDVQLSALRYCVVLQLRPDRKDNKRNAKPVLPACRLWCYTFPESWLLGNQYFVVTKWCDSTSPVPTVLQWTQTLPTLKTLVSRQSQYVAAQQICAGAANDPKASQKFLSCSNAFKNYRISQMEWAHKYFAASS